MPVAVRAPSSAAPARVAGRAIHSAARVDTSVMPTIANSASATSRPTTFATMSQCAVAVAMSAAAVNAIARPPSMGAVSRAKLRSERANTSGMIGRMHGLRIVSTPPRNASTSISTIFSWLSYTPYERKRADAVTRQPSSAAMLRSVTAERASRGTSAAARDHRSPRAPARRWSRAPPPCDPRHPP